MNKINNKQKQDREEREGEKNKLGLNESRINFLTIIKMIKTQ